MLPFHRVWAWVVVASNLGVGIAGVWIAIKRRPAPRWLWPGILAGQIALAIQVVIGVAMTQSGRKAPGLHVFYGFVVLIAAALSWAFRGESPRRMVAVSAGVALFVGAVAVRAVITA